jgi:hypothetical protein
LQCHGRWSLQSTQYGSELCGWLHSSQAFLGSDSITLPMSWILQIRRGDEHA